MKLNKVQAVASKLSRIRFAIGLIIVGLIMGGISGFIAYSTLTAEEPQQLDTIVIVILAIGVLAVIIGIVLLVKAIKDKNPDKLQQVDLSKVSQAKIDEVKNNKEPLEEYYFHFTGKLNQSYVLETTDRKPIISMTCDKIGVVSKFQFTFKNHLTSKSTHYEVSHTLTSRTGGNGWSIPNKSSFKVNGVDVFKMIADQGYSIVSKIEKFRLNFDICHYGVQVATLRAGGANVAKADKNYGKLGNLPTTGVFTVNAKKSDLDVVALIAFAVSRVEFF